ncbi:hypothetical protein [Planococcus kocurii]|nr:hypothetical protein [Planococcus kocurii]
MKTDSLSLAAEKVGEILGAEMELHEGFWQVIKKRTIKAHTSFDMCVSWSLELSVSFKPSTHNQLAINKAEVFLLPEELASFTGAPIQHPIHFPSSFSQRLSTERGMHCIRLASKEPPEDFAKRLTEALCVLS